ncbi:hypothetical protein MJT46_008805 [Ovis ammon polii x Ovis aries]|nr:hypothetical protein MJT46_008805 [Ovis ammon polii x Ovis aries]
MPVTLCCGICTDDKNQADPYMAANFQYEVVEMNKRISLPSCRNSEDSPPDIPGTHSPTAVNVEMVATAFDTRGDTESFSPKVEKYRPVIAIAECLTECHVCSKMNGRKESLAQAPRKTGPSQLTLLAAATLDRTPIGNTGAKPTDVQDDVFYLDCGTQQFGMYTNSERNWHKNIIVFGTVSDISSVISVSKHRFCYE